MRTNLGFEFRHCARLPRLAWCLELDDASNVARVSHGDWVAIRGTSFFEGAWAGDWSAGDFDSCFMTGTGARLHPEGVTFVAPNHTLDRLNVLRKAGVLYVSNSLSFLFALSGEALDPGRLFYDSYVASIRYGVRKYEPSIATKSGLAVQFFYCCNLLLDRDGELSVASKRPSPRFSSYGEYRRYLDETVSRIAMNAADARREVRFAPLATVSRGYDSPAALVVGTAVGCREALTFRQSRGTAGDEDCGTAIAERLGIAAREFGRLDYRTHPDFPEIENSGGPNEFLSFGEAPAGRLLFTGFHGDKLWDRNCHKVSRHLVRGDSSGSSLTEYRLRVGFFHLPVPFIGADSHPELHAIANSSEMSPWSLGTLYDRPIARRIVEEAGVPRSLFGQQKRAAGVKAASEGLDATLSHESGLDFARFVEETWDLAKTLKVHAVKLIELLAYCNRGAARLVERLGHRFRVSLPRVPELIPHPLAMLAFGYVGKESLLFHWGVAKLVERYARAIDNVVRTAVELSAEGRIAVLQGVDEPLIPEAGPRDVAS
jgi:hypothetical protein